MSDLLNEMLIDSERLPSDDKLENVKELCKNLLGLRARIDNLEDALSESKQARIQIERVDLPSAMASAGCKKFITDDGFTITVEPFATAKIDDDNREKCFTWIEENGFADIIKHEISVSLTKGEDETAQRISNFLKEIGASYIDGKSIHWKTLASFVKEQFQKGTDIPLDTFKAFVGTVAKVKK